ncbi:predicted protein [Naegleria gruberi]|uniref:Predicted protein n=1 Tax=Naegleria gruberi TaxID=5762 RepID=D2VLV0_NAEGR|nr:uncharacterized protein NAEGRDRAFT_69908 [Naegleria gruberi]EFC42120.1 predicted protein [Naegleria gruberi]|eukprot:XP_002674864.1 predicted protein [Naegleria gruberi strain NEG-M]
MSLLQNLKRIEFYTAFICPYAHRSLIAIIESQLQGKLPKFASVLNSEETKPIYYNEIDLLLDEQTKEHYKRINPQGKVPALKLVLNDDTSLVVNESLVIGEFIQETFNPNLLPQSENPIETAFAKAQYKIWTSYFDSNFTSLFFKISFEKLTVDAVITEQLPITHEKISFLVQNGFKPNQKGRGDFFFGDQFSLLDGALIPFIIRFDSNLRNQYGVDLFKPLPTDNETVVESLAIFKKWYQAVRARPSVKKSAYEPDFVPLSTTSNATRKVLVSGYEATLEEEQSGKKKEIVSATELQVDWFDYERYLTRGYELRLAKLQK